MLARRHLLATLPALAVQAPRYDIVIKNGEVRDPRTNFKANADVAILNGKIAAVEPSIPTKQARETIDAKGLYVTPGIVDRHTHIFYGAGSVPGIEADPVAARSGVTTWVGAGSFAYDNATGFQNRVRVYGFVYRDPIKWARAAIRPTAEAIAKNPETLLGVKAQIGVDMNGQHSPEFLKINRELRDENKLKLMVHISDAPPEVPAIMEQMR